MMPKRKNHLIVAKFVEEGKEPKKTDPYPEIYSEQCGEDFWAACRMKPVRRVAEGQLHDIDRFLYWNGHFTFIVNLSLDVIVTNSSMYLARLNTRMVVFLIYNSHTLKFARVQLPIRHGKQFCVKCVKFQAEDHVCTPTCAICLRREKCESPKQNFTQLVCFKCGAHCHTEDCFYAHRRICPRPKSALYRSLLHYVKNNVVPPAQFELN